MKKRKEIKRFILGTVLAVVLVGALGSCLPTEESSSGNPSPVGGKGHALQGITSSMGGAAYSPTQSPMEEVAATTQPDERKSQTPSTMPASQVKTQGGISPQKAEEAVRKFLGDAALEVHCRGKEKLGREEGYQVRAGPDRFHVSLAGQVTYGHFSHVDTSREVQLSLEEAEAKARQFLTDHGFNLAPEFRRAYAELLDHGDAGKEYYFKWDKIVDNVRWPGYASVEVSPGDGTILGFSWQDEPVTVTTTPKIPQQEALAKAQQACRDMEIAKGEVTYLAVGFDRQGQQRLYWVVSLEGKPRVYKFGGWIPVVTVTVDALTGEAEVGSGTQKPLR